MRSTRIKPVGSYCDFDSEMNLKGFKYVVLDPELQQSGPFYYEFEPPYFVFSDGKTTMMYDYIQEHIPTIISQYTIATNIRPSNLTVSGSGSLWIDGEKAKDLNWGDDTTYSVISRTEYPEGDSVGYGELIWDSLKPNSSALYLTVGYESQDQLGSGIDAKLCYSIDNGSTFKELSSWIVDGSSSNSVEKVVKVLPHINFSNLRVKAEVHSYKSGNLIDYCKVRIYDAYIKYW